MSVGVEQSPVARALAAEPQLRAIDRLVHTLVKVAPSCESQQPLCAECVWSEVVKPLIEPYVGWHRGKPASQARDRDPDDPGWRVFVLSELDALPGTPEPATKTERWLRTEEAWHAVTGHWMELLYDADPANGHHTGHVEHGGT